MLTPARRFTVPDDKLSPAGERSAIGHAFGPSGTRYVMTLATEHCERTARYGVSACASAQNRASPWSGKPTSNIGVTLPHCIVDDPAAT